MKVHTKYLSKITVINTHLLDLILAIVVEMEKFFEKNFGS